MTDKPSNLKVERDLGGLRYRVATWEKALGKLLLRYLLLAAMTIALIAGAGSVLALLLNDPGLLGTLFQMSFTAAMMLPALLAIFWVYQDVAVDVRIDQNAMHMTRRAGAEQVTWAACDGVRRKGRLIEVQIDGRWRQLPSPKGYTDAAWLEDLVRDKIDARRGEAVAPPEEVAAALRALGAQRERSR